MVDGPSLQGPRRRNSPEPYADLVARFVKLRQDMNDLTGSILRSAGIRLTETLMTITRNLRVEGTFTSTGAANIGGTMNVTGDAVFSGDLAVPNGSITNDALQNPVAYRTGFANNDVLVIGTSETTTASFSIAVPAGYTQALLVASSQMGVYNASASVASAASRIYMETSTASEFSGRSWTDVPAGFDFAINTTWQAVMAVAAGQTITFRLAVIGDPAWPGDAGFATINGYALFTR